MELTDAVANVRLLAREQVSAAWQMHIDRIREQLDQGWRESLEEIFDERFTEVEQRLREGYDTAVEQQSRSDADRLLEPTRIASRRETIDKLNSLARRIRQSESREQAIQTLLEGAKDYCGTAALFAVVPAGLRLEGSETIVSLAAAPAFGNAVETKDTVVAEGTPGELSQEVVSAMGDASESRVYLLPVVLRDHAIAVLYAQSNGSAPDVNALELLAALAAPSLEIPPLVVVVDPPPAPPPAWSELSREEQENHLRAQRFARNRVAELVLHRITLVREARAGQRLYPAFREEIDAARNDFRREFFHSTNSMVDYLHLELVRTLAKEDAESLGSEYPGPLL